MKILLTLCIAMLLCSCTMKWDTQTKSDKEVVMNAFVNGWLRGYLRATDPKIDKTKFELYLKMDSVKLYNQLFKKQQ